MNTFNSRRQSVSYAFDGLVYSSIALRLLNKNYQEERTKTSTVSLLPIGRTIRKRMHMGVVG